MKEQRPLASPIRFGVYEVDLVSEELRKNGLKIKLSGQPFQILAMLLERPGEVVTREELQKKLWPDGTFVDFDHSLNTAINKIREALGDSAENPRLVEALARRGYRFIAPVESFGTVSEGPAAEQTNELGSNASELSHLHERSHWRSWLAFGTVAALAVGLAVLIYQKLKPSPLVPQRALKRLTLDTGLQFGATWSPDGRFIAYCSDRGGKFDIWVQPVSGGDAVQVTKGPGYNWQPDWSPDGKLIVFRSERSAGGLYVVPALGGAERKITSFGYRPRWSPDSSQILFETHFADLPSFSRFYVVSLDGVPAREILAEFLKQHNLYARSTAWHPDGRRISVWVGDLSPSPILWTVPLSGGAAVKTEPVQEVATQLREVALSGTAGNFGDLPFSWAPSGKAIYFGATFGGARNLWRMTIEPETLRATAMERLTTGPGPDTNPRVSPDGGRLAFTAGPRHIRVWLFPFDATRGRVQRKGLPGDAAWDGRLEPRPVQGWKEIGIFCQPRQ